jgi:hypothetical protein
MYADLVALGYRGSYDRVAAFARLWHQRQRESAQTAGRGTFVPLVFAPGEAFQFDWSEDWAVVGGERQKLKVAHMKLGHSRAFVMRAYRQETHEMLFDAHNHALRVLGGVPARGLYDNMKTAVDKLGRGKVRVVNARFKALTSHYLFDAEFCNPASGWEKGQVEKQVQDARRRVWHDIPSFPTLAALNVWLEAKCVALWPSIKHPEQARPHGGRGVGGRASAADAVAGALRRLPRADQASLADLPGGVRASPLQRAFVVRQSAGESARVCRAPGHRRRRRGHRRARTAHRPRA